METLYHVIQQFKADFNILLYYIIKIFNYVYFKYLQEVNI